MVRTITIEVDDKTLDAIILMFGKTLNLTTREDAMRAVEGKMELARTEFVTRTRQQAAMVERYHRRNPA